MMKQGADRVDRRTLGSEFVMVGATFGLILFWAGWCIWYGGRLAFLVGAGPTRRLAGWETLTGVLLCEPGRCADSGTAAPERQAT
jgi:hypothetical protein